MQHGPGVTTVVVGPTLDAVAATNADACRVYVIAHAVQAEHAPTFADFDALVDELEANPGSQQQLAAGRRWVGQALYAGPPTLASLRLAAGLSQRQLGDLCNLQQPHVSRYEAGRVEPSLGMAHAMAQALGVDLATLHAAWQATAAAAAAAPVVPA
jgi:DNA-binding XRE family transcriptional regulator